MLSLPAGFALGCGVEWLLSRMGIDIAPYVRYLLPMLIVAFVVYSLVSFRRYAKLEAALLKADFESQQIQEIHIENAPVIQVEAVSDKLPVVCFDIGDNRLLFLWGQWLTEPETYGMTGNFEDTDEDETHLNYIRDPYGFPSTKFVIVRAPNSGFVFKIEIKGSYLSPSKIARALKVGYDLGDSELLVGNIEELPQLLHTASLNRLSGVIQPIGGPMAPSTLAEKL